MRPGLPRFSLIYIDLLTDLLTDLLIYLLIYLMIYLLIYLLTDLFTYWFTYLLIYLLTDLLTYLFTDWQTDRSSYRNVRMYLRHSYNVIVDLWFIILNRFGVNHFISTGFTNWLLTDRPTDLPIEMIECNWGTSTMLLLMYGS